MEYWLYGPVLFVRPKPIDRLTIENPEYDDETGYWHLFLFSLPIFELTMPQPHVKAQYNVEFAAHEKAFALADSP